MVYAVFYTFLYVNNWYKWQESDCITVSRIWHRLYFQLLSSHVRFRRGFLNLEVTPRPARRDTTDRGCFYRNHSQTSLIFHLSLPFFFLLSPGALSSSPVRHHDTRGGTVMIHLHLCLIINSMVIKYSHTRVASSHQTSSPLQLSRRRWLKMEQTQNVPLKTSIIQFNTHLVQHSRQNNCKSSIFLQNHR